MRDEMKEWAMMLTTIIFFVLFVAVLASISSANDVETIIREAAEEHGIEPDLALAIAHVESGLNPNARGGLGEVGVFQLRPEYHEVEPGNVRHNIRVAMRYLAYVRERCAEYLEAWVICFNLGPYYKRINYPTLFPYYRKVERVRRMIAGGSYE